ncbi:MAG: AAA family ATPase [Candidatus Gastranaerophilales bacterium]|nr:AAA family ATPase [Candidatus Gastranaerophilales bacterium]MCM1072800.1 AAA family ATPase [Bacteroides sp.]
MTENNDFHHLIEKELNSTDKILKPDFTQKAGRELLAFYLQSKFKQVLAYDTKAPEPIFTEVRYDFIQKFSKRLITNPAKKIMVGITGESASGKSTICREISNTIKKFDMPVTILTTDNYFNDISELIKKYGTFDALRDNGYDVDSPESFQLDVLKEDLEKISQGEDVYSPEYLLNGTGVSVPKAKHVPSNKIVVVEGMASMYDDIKDVFDIKVYVETDINLRRERFMTRAYTERNQDLENAKKHWEYILGAGEKYVKPAKEYADIIINGDTNLTYFCQILEYIYTITNNFRG